MAVVVERARGLAGALFDRPVPGRREGGQQEAAKGDLFEEGRKGNAEAEHEPRRAGRSKHIVDRRVGRSGQQLIVDDREYDAAHGNGDQTPAELESRRAAPMDAGKKALVPNQRKDDEAQSQSDEIEDRFAAQNVMNVGLDAVQIRRLRRNGSGRRPGSEASCTRNRRAESARSRTRWPRCGMRVGGTSLGLETRTEIVLAVGLCG